MDSLKDLTKRALENAIHLHVERYDSNSVFSTPFEQGDYIHASDKYTVIAVPKSLDKSLEYRKLDSPNVMAVLCEYSPTYIVTADNIKEALIQADINPDMHDIVCCDCRGSGIVDWTYTDRNGNEYEGEFDCPVCQGNSYIPNGIGKFISLKNDIAISGQLLRRIYGSMVCLDASTAKLSLLSHLRARFDLDNGIIMLAMLNSKSSYLCNSHLSLTKFTE